MTTRYVSTSVALCYDSKHDRMVKVVSNVDEDGQRWEEYDGGPPVAVEMPAKRKSEKAQRTSKE